MSVTGWQPVTPAAGALGGMRASSAVRDVRTWLTQCASSTATRASLPAWYLYVRVFRVANECAKNVESARAASTLIYAVGGTKPGKRDQIKIMLWVHSQLLEL